MNMRYIFLIGTFITLLISTKEVPIEGSTFPPEPDMMMKHEHGSHIIIDDDKSDKEKYETSDKKDSQFDSTVDRTNHSRMQSESTTLGYDEWWFLTTRRPQHSLKDFPGRPGVATWKEISPGSSVENRKSPKKHTPTAAGVSSGSRRIALKSHYTEILWKAYWMIVLLFCFCWT